MGEAKNWIEVAIFLAGWLAVIAALKQGQKDLKEGQDKMGTRLDRMGDKLDLHSSAVQLHGEQIGTLKKSAEDHEQTNSLIHDEMKGALARHGRQIHNMEKWQAVADSSLRRIDPQWQAPSGD